MWYPNLLALKEHLKLNGTLAVLKKKKKEPIMKKGAALNIKLNKTLCDSALFLPPILKQHSNLGLL